MISLVLIFIASSLNACMDTLSQHWSTSIFSNISGYFFSDATTTSWLNKYVNRDVNKGLIYWNVFGVKFEKPVFLTDGWHLFKSIMIVFLILSIVFYPLFKLTGLWYLDILVLGTVWNLTFSLFYNKILLK